MAVEKAKARGVEVDMLLVGDDVGIGRCKGRRDWEDEESQGQQWFRKLLEH